MLDSRIEAPLPVLVTGAAGFLGGWLVRALCRRGHRVRALVRATSDVTELDGLELELVEGDLDDRPSLLRAAAGQRLVFHTAARVSDWGPRAEFLKVNLEGTRGLVEACRATGVARLVHLSSLTVLGLPRDGRTVVEETPCPPPLDAYSESKLAGERLVRESHDPGGLSTTVVRPGVIWGPGDRTIMPRFARLLRRRQMILIDGGANQLGLSHVENLADGLVLAGEAPAAAGQIYHLTDDEPVTARDAICGLADAIGEPRPRRSLPYFAVHAIASALEAGARLVRSATPPRLTRYGVRLVACDCRYPIAKARRELGYQPRIRFAEGIAALGEIRSC